jgi:hypothetical protein
LRSAKNHAAQDQARFFAFARSAVKLDMANQPASLPKNRIADDAGTTPETDAMAFRRSGHLKVGMHQWYASGRVQPQFSELQL